jgi:hypothetical protein
MRHFKSARQLQRLDSVHDQVASPLTRCRNNTNTQLQRSAHILAFPARESATFTPMRGTSLREFCLPRTAVHRPYINRLTVPLRALAAENEATKVAIAASVSN